MGVEEIAIKEPSRVKVRLKCLACRDSYILRVDETGDGFYQTEFKRCLCGNDQIFHIEPLHKK